MNDLPDAIDRTLLSCLQADGRLSAQALSGKVKLTARATLMRIHRLEQRGWIQGYSARLDRQLIAPHFLVFAEVTLRNRQAQARRKFSERVQATPEVLACHQIDGNYDFLLRLCCRDRAHCDELTNRWLADADLEIEHINTMPELQTVKEFTQLPIAEAPQLMMSPPDYFEVSYSINPWMDPSAWTANAQRLRDDARQGWQRLRKAYIRLGAQIHIQPAVQTLPDLVFTANSAVVLDRKVLLARFKPLERRGEQAHNQHIFEQLKAEGLIDSIHPMPEGVFFEGAGDALWDANRRMLWLGWGQRSSFEAAETIRSVFGTQTASLRLVDPRFYHLDTCLCVLSGGEIICFPDAFDAPSLALLRATVGDQLIEASERDASHLGVNSVCIGRDIVMGYCSNELGAQLRSRGYRVTKVSLGSFNRSGGSAFCLTLRLDNRSS